MEIQNLNNLFDNLHQDEKSDIQTRQVIQGDVSLIIAELKSGKKLPAHYHVHGDEIYQVLAGQGCMEVGELDGDKSVIWNESFELKAGDILKIAPLAVHRLSGGSQNLRLIFITPPSHLGEDRIFIDLGE